MLRRSKGVYDLTGLPPTLTFEFSVYVDLTFTQVPAFLIQVSSLESIASFQNSLRHLLPPEHQPYHWFIYHTRHQLELPFNESKEYLYEIMETGDWIRIKFTDPSTSITNPTVPSSISILPTTLPPLTRDSVQENSNDVSSSTSLLPLTSSDPPSSSFSSSSHSTCTSNDSVPRFSCSTPPPPSPPCNASSSTMVHSTSLSPLSFLRLHRCSHPATPLISSS